MKTYALNVVESGKGAPIVYLHGMTGSLRSWDGVISKMSNHHNVVIDLLGFGKSPKPRSGEYSYQQHVKSILLTLKEKRVKYPFTLVGFSLGALLALRIAKDYPKLVKKVVLLSPPIYQDRSEAEAMVVAGSGWPRWLVFGRRGLVLCKLWCRQRYLSKHLAPLLFRHLPKAVAQNTVYHTYRSYRRTLDRVMLEQTALADIKKVKAPITIIYGNKDGLILPLHLQKLSQKPSIKLYKLGAKHAFLYKMPAKVAQLIG